MGLGVGITAVIREGGDQRDGIFRFWLPGCITEDKLGKVPLSWKVVGDLPGPARLGSKLHVVRAYPPGGCARQKPRRQVTTQVEHREERAPATDFHS